MGGVAPTNATRPLSAKPHMYWGARKYWANARERLVAFVSRRLFQHSSATLDILLKLYTSLGGHCLADSPIYVKGGAAARLYLCQQCRLLPASVANARARLVDFVSRRLFQHSSTTLDILLKLYTSLGGHCLADSPIYVKGGAAAWLYLCQQCCLLPASVANAIGEVSPPADLDFGSVAPKGNTIEAAANALLWIQELADGLKMNKVWPLWEVRSDTRRGEAFFHGSRYQLGQVEKSTYAKLPFKVTYHGGLAEQASGDEFNLIRIGLGLWHKRLARSTTASIVDICVGGKRPLRTLTVMGVRAETPRSMLRALRSMTFHETSYEPWWTCFCLFSFASSRNGEEVRF